MSVNVKTVTGRRTLKFTSYDDIRRDVEQLMSCGQIKSLGNWTAGQNFEHMAKSIHACIDGIDYEMAWPFRMIARVFRNYFLSSPMKPGFHLPRPMEPAFGPSDQISQEQGYRLLIDSLTRIQSTTQRAPSPAFGEMTEPDWIRLHCRHAELHLSFLVNV